MENNTSVIFGLFLFCLYTFGQTAGQCIFPDEWNSTWYDSRTGQILMNKTHGGLEGWTVNIKPGGTVVGTVISWNCIFSGSSDNYFALRSDNLIPAYGGSYIIYICIEVTKVTDYSYFYYLRSDKLSDAEDMRVKMKNEVDTPTLAELCTYTSGPSKEEFHILVKKGDEESARQYCPAPLLGVFNYIYDDGTTEHCDTGSQWDVCTDRTTMNYNYTLCNITQAYSQEGQVSCLAYIQASSIYYLSVLNSGTVDNSVYFRFTCYAIQMNGTDVIASQHPGGCEIGQTPTIRPTGGGLITLTPYAFTTSSISGTTLYTTTTLVASAGTESQTIALIAGIVLGITALLIGLFSSTMLCKKCNKSSMNKVHEEKIVIERDSESVFPTPRPQDKQKLAPLELETLDHLPNGIEPTFKAPLPPIAAR